MIADRIIFLHIPKTAGTSIRAAFDRLLDDDEILALYPKTEWAFEPDRITEIPERTRRKARLVIGHVKHGIAEHFPGASLYATVVRDPVERVLSSYYLHERAIETEGPQSPLQKSIASGELDLRSFAERQGNRNVQTRFVAGRGGKGRQTLERALANLETDFIAVGTTSRADDLVAAIARGAGWGEPEAVPRRNTNRLRPPTAEEPDDLLAHIAELNDLDARLVSHIERVTDAGAHPLLLV